jgi:hypothetical protein
MVLPFLCVAPKEDAAGVSTAQRSRLFREVNDRIYELLESADPDLPGEFLCECGRDCERRVPLLPASFATLRQTGEAVRSPDCLEPRSRLRDEPVSLIGGVPALG